MDYWDTFIKISSLPRLKMPAGLEARVDIDNKFRTALSRLTLKSHGISVHIADQLRKEGINTSRENISKILRGKYHTVPCDFYSKVVGEEPDNKVFLSCLGKEPRAVIDDKLKDALLKRRNGLDCKELSELLVKKGHKTTPDMLSGIRRVNSIRTVPYDLYVEIVGEEPKEIHRKEPIDLARKISNLYSYFSDVDKKEFARQLAKELRQHGIHYSETTLRRSLFHEGVTSTIDSRITDILVEKFKNLAGMPNASLDEVEEFVNSLGPPPPGPLKPYKANWNTLRPIIDDLHRLTGLSLAAIVEQKGASRKKFERGEMTLSLEKSIEKYLQHQRLVSELRKQPPYELHSYRCKLVQLLGHAKFVLQNTGSGNIRVEHIKYLPDILVLNKNELQLVNKGQQNYGEKAFMENIFPPHVRMKKEYHFPIECFEMIVMHPENNGNGYGRQLGIFAECLGNSLAHYYKEGILDKNKERGFNFGVTEDGIRLVLREAKREFNYYNSTRLFQMSLKAPSLKPFTYSNALRFP